jgi:hypothetical protein
MLSHFMNYIQFEYAFDIGSSDRKMIVEMHMRTNSDRVYSPSEADFQAQFFMVVGIHYLRSRMWYSMSSLE